MVRWLSLVGMLSFVFAVCANTRDATAQRLYVGSTPSELQFSGQSGIDMNGRAVNVDGRTFDRYGQQVDSYGWPAPYYRTPYYATIPGANGSLRVYSGYGNPNGVGYSPSLGGFTGGGSTFRPGPPSAGTSISPPRSVMVGGVYPTRTVMNNATRGATIEYTHNGNGYVSNPGSTYQTVIGNGPTIFPYVSVVPPTQPPVMIDSRPTQSTAQAWRGGSVARTPQPPAFINPADIRLVFPSESATPLTYLLNGTIYNIKPGYSQTFNNDRVWTIEFLRAGNGSLPMRYVLSAGTYRFIADANGWDLQKDQPIPPGVTPSASASPATQPPPLTPSLTPAPTPGPDF